MVAGDDARTAFPPDESGQFSGGPALAHLDVLYQMCGSLALGGGLYHYFDGRSFIVRLHLLDRT